MKKFRVVCEDYTTPLYNLKRDAQDVCDSFNENDNCHYEHRIEEQIVGRPRGVKGKTPVRKKVADDSITLKQGD